MSFCYKNNNIYNPKKSVVKMYIGTVSPPLFSNRVSIKFYNFFMKFRHEKDERNDVFYWKTQKLFKGSKIWELEEYKFEQLQWIKQNKCKNDISLLICMCKARIKYFLDLLKDYTNTDVDISHLEEEAYKVTIQSCLSPRIIKPNTKAFKVQMGSFFSGIIQANNIKLQFSESSAFKPINSIK
jgi:hypothetical protein